MKLITKKGFNELKKELEKRKTELRRKIAGSIKEAKEQGDLSENAEYAEAKRHQRENESRIMYLENLIKTSKVVDENSKKKGRVEIGSEVEVETKGSRMTFYIVGSNEADPTAGKISHESPIGKSFLGRKKGDSVEVLLPSKKKVVYKIINLK
jgi:transcription elongation factor GreA